MKLTIQSIRQLIVWTVLVGFIYPLAITGVARLLFRDQANGKRDPRRMNGNQGPKPGDVHHVSEFL